MRYELIVFDLDGTLLDSQAHIIQCVQSVSVQLGLPEPTRAQVRAHTGKMLEQQITGLFPELSLIHQEHFISLFKDCFYTAKRSHGLFDGVQETLSWLNEHGLFTAIATNMSRYGLNEVLAATPLGELVAGSRCADECSAKPRPDMVLELMDQFVVEPTKTLMIGDTELDLQCGQNAGVDVIAVDYTGSHRERLEAQQPLMIIDDLLALRSFVELG